jgi:nucleotide-binding universal stress UspA family protein
MSAVGHPLPRGPVLIAYDGSDLAARGIEEAARLLRAGAEALVVCVWQPFDVGFVTPHGIDLNAEQAAEVRSAAETTAAAGAKLANDAGFAARSQAVVGAPTWRAIVETAEDADAQVIVLGSHGHSGLSDLLLGSVAGAVAGHSRRTVLIAHAPERQRNSD